MKFRMQPEGSKVTLSCTRTKGGLYDLNIFYGKGRGGVSEPSITVTLFPTEIREFAHGLNTLVAEEDQRV